MYLSALPFFLGLVAPQVSFLIQSMNELGSQLDVIAEHLLVLSDAINIAHPPGQVPIYPWCQFTVSQLQKLESKTDFYSPNCS